MRDNEVSKVYMWIIVEEVRAHKSVMPWGMVFGVLVPVVGASRGPVNLEVDLAGVITDIVEKHVDRHQSFLLDCIVCKNHCYGFIYFHWSGGLGMPEFLKGRTDW